MGLGNTEITPDALGPAVARGIFATRHIPKELTKAAGLDLLRQVSVITPGVLGQTGIEAGELIKAAAEKIKPAAVIVIDALAAQSGDRLFKTVQLCDTGISPGAGVGNDRPALSREYMGVPVIALGVPMVVDSSTLVTDMLEMAGVDPLPEGLEPVLKNGRSFFVSLKEADAALEALTDLLAEGIDLAMEAAG